MEDPDVQLAAVDPESTIRPSLSWDPADGQPSRARDLLTRPSPSDAVEAFGVTLGQGGMAVVREATQVSMQRRVAVKSVRPEASTPRSVYLLLQEAWLTGTLQHPGIVPIHDIAIDRDGHPHILMKRIDGTHWGAIAADPDAVRERFGATDLLEWNLRTFLAVCNAVHYAHESGVLHRDLKPENVMIGRFGEVYVVDWGIAVAVDDRYDGRMPLARDERRLAGSPRFMAPEMVTCDGSALTVRTDVYLLGATLYAVLAGRPPHQGSSLREIIGGIPTFRPGLPDGVPAPLAEILARATAVDPLARPESAEALRLEVQRFLERRGSVQLASHATDRLEALRRHVGDEGASREEVYGEYAAARFGFSEALRGWPDHPQANHGLRETHLALVRYELSVGEAGAARMALAEVESPPAEVLRALEGLEAERARSEAELQAFRRDADPGIGVRTRLFVTGIIVVIWMVRPLTWEYLGGTESYVLESSFNLAMIVGLFGLFVWARDSLSKTAVNRNTALTILIVVLANLFIDTTAQILAIPHAQGRTLRIAGWTLISAMYAVTVEPRLAPTVASWAILALVAAAQPEQFVICVALGNLIMVLNIAVLWGGRLRSRG